MIHGKNQAEIAKRNFELTFQKKRDPIDIRSLEYICKKNEIKLIHLMKDVKLCKSYSEANRLIKQKAVSINKEKITNQEYKLKTGSDLVLQVGKRKFLRVVIR